MNRLCSFKEVDNSFISLFIIRHFVFIIHQPNIVTRSVVPFGDRFSRFFISYRFPSRLVRHLIINTLEGRVSTDNVNHREHVLVGYLYK